MMPASILAVVLLHRISSGGCHYPALALAPQLFSGHRSITENTSHRIFSDIRFWTFVHILQKHNAKNQNYESLS